MRAEEQGSSDRRTAFPFAQNLKEALTHAGMHLQWCQSDHEIYVELNNESVIEVSVLGEGRLVDFAKYSSQRPREIKNIYISFSHLTTKGLQLLEENLLCRGKGACFNILLFFLIRTIRYLFHLTLYTWNRSTFGYCLEVTWFCLSSL
jgi:hypothetical protein